MQNEDWALATLLLLSEFIGPLIQSVSHGERQQNFSQPWMQVQRVLGIAYVDDIIVILWPRHLFCTVLCSLGNTAVGLVQSKTHSGALAIFDRKSVVVEV